MFYNYLWINAFFFCSKFGLDFCFCDNGVKFDFNFYWVLVLPI